jgi:hypothetical protein
LAGSCRCSEACPMHPFLLLQMKPAGKIPKSRRAATRPMRDPEPEQLVREQLDDTVAGATSSSVRTLPL